MTTLSNDYFYNHLPVTGQPLHEVLRNGANFSPLPGDWFVMVSDVRDSTTAVMNGLQQEVNMAATGCAVAVLNITANEGINIPFFFGGDGVTFLVPARLVEPLFKMLQVHRMEMLSHTSLDLRIGALPVADVYKSGHRLQIAKYTAGGGVVGPVLIGGGLAYAEKIIKNSPQPLNNPYPGTVADLRGMLCRWDEIPAPAADQEIITLLVTVIDETAHEEVFCEVIRMIGDIFGPPLQRQPITKQKLKLRSTFMNIGAELRDYSGRMPLKEKARTKFRQFLGWFYFETPPGKAYLDKLLTMSETLLIDGRINTVISGTAEQRAALTDFLDFLEKQGAIVYGIHISRSTIMSCYVRPSDDRHIYFVDGAQGGYTNAAKMMKAKHRDPGFSQT